MNVILKKLEFSNMFSYGPDNTILLNENKITQLNAVNGSGKTSLSLIIQELLFSKNVKNIKKGDILNRHTTDKNWSGNLLFNVDADEYDITVTRTGATSKVKLLQNSIDISEHKVLDTYKKLVSILGMDFDIFKQLTYQSSKDLLEFINATDTNRKKFLINLFKLNKYIEIGEEIKKLLSNAEKELNIKQGELTTVESFLNSTTINDKRSMKEVPEVEENIRNEIASLQNELKNYHELCKKIDSNNNFISEVASLKFDMSLIKPQLDNQIIEDIDTGKGALASKNTEIQTLNRQLKVLDLSDTCYTCGQSIDNSNAVRMTNDITQELNNKTKDVNILKEVIKTNEAIKLKYNIELKAYNNNQKTIERFEHLNQVIDNTTPKNYPDYSQIENTLKNLQTKLRTQESTYKQVIDYNNSITSHNTKIDTLVEQKQEFLTRQTILNSAIISLNEKVSNLTILRKAFSTTGIVAYKLESLTKELEDTINLYLSELSDGKFQIEFRLDGEKLNIIVIDNGKEAPIETASGGEFSRIQTAILLSIRSLLSKIGGNYVNLLFLDEIFSVLDDAGKEKLIEVLLEEPLVNIFLVSHEYEHPLIPKINIQKNNDISYIE